MKKKKRKNSGQGLVFYDSCVNVPNLQLLLLLLSSSAMSCAAWGWGQVGDAPLVGEGAAHQSSPATGCPSTCPQSGH